MKIIPIKQVNIPELIDLLKIGKIIIYPTETCYGLGCDATNQNAVDRLNKIKQRGESKSFLVLASDTAMVRQYVEWNGMAEELAKKYWPGALTMILTATFPSSLARGVVKDDGTTAFRVTSHPFASALTKHLGLPLVSTSANIGGADNLYSSAAVISQFEHADSAPDYIIDSDILPEVPPSTIVSFVHGKVEVVRQGSIIV